MTGPSEALRPLKWQWWLLGAYSLQNIRETGSEVSTRHKYAPVRSFEVTILGYSGTVHMGGSLLLGRTDSRDTWQYGVSPSLPAAPNPGR